MGIIKSRGLIFKEFFIDKKIFFLLSLAFFLSSIGTSFTSVVIYYTLDINDSAYSVFTWVFAAGTIPGLITSIWAGKNANKKSVFRIVLICQISTCIVLIISIIEFKLNNFWFLIAAEVAASASGGILLPFSKTVEKKIFGSKNLEFLAIWDTVIFTLTFIFGQGLASLLLVFINPLTLLYLDLISYVVCLFIIIAIRKPLTNLNKKRRESVSPRKIDKTKYTKEQKDVLYNFAWLSLVCAPPMALLPSFGRNFDSINMFEINSTLLLICSRTLGQIMGPFITGLLRIKSLHDSTLLPPLMLLIYLLCYSYVFFGKNIIIACALVISAHTFSNIAFTITQFRFLSVFDEEDIGMGAALNYRVTTFIISASAIISGYWVDMSGILPIYICLIIIAIMGYYVVNSSLYGNCTEEKK